MFFKLLLILFPFLLNSWSEASKERFGVILYKDVNQRGSLTTYSLDPECIDLSSEYNIRSAERVHGSCVYLCSKSYHEISNLSDDCERLGNPDHPKGARTIDDKDMKVRSICDCTYRNGMEEKSEGEEDSRDLREIKYYGYGSPKRNLLINACSVTGGCQLIQCTPPTVLGIYPLLGCH